MKRSLRLLTVGLLAAACQKDDPKLAPPKAEAEDPDWIKLEIKTAFSGDEAYAIVGDIDKTLLVSTKAQVFSSSDKGKTWRESKNFFGLVYGLLSRNDTIFALISYRENSQGDKLEAAVADMFTTDFGKTWAYTGLLPNGYYKSRAFTQPFGRLTAGSITYRTKENSVPVPNSTSRLMVASDLVRTNGPTQTTMRLPARHYLKNLHLDTQQRLYVAASGLRFDATTGDAIDPKKGRPAVVYVSRRPLP